MWDSIWINAHFATLRSGKYGVIRRGALAAAQDRIAWIGAHADLPGEPAQLRAKCTIAQAAGSRPG
jgi:imidazolonepropionase